MTFEFDKKKRNASTIKMVPLSTRVTQEDAEFLSSIVLPGAATPSELLRVIISEYRKRAQSGDNYRSSLLLYQEMLNLGLTAVRETEFRHQVHSEVVSRIYDWLPDMMAYVTSTATSLQVDKNQDQLEEFESGIADRIFRLLQSIMQMGVTEKCPCYNPATISDRLEPVLNLANVIHK